MFVRERKYLFRSYLISIFFSVEYVHISWITASDHSIGRPGFGLTGTMLTQRLAQRPVLRIATNGNHEKCNRIDVLHMCPALKTGLYFVNN